MKLMRSTTDAARRIVDELGPNLLSQDPLTISCVARRIADLRPSMDICSYSLKLSSDLSSPMDNVSRLLADRSSGPHAKYISKKFEILEVSTMLASQAIPEELFLWDYVPHSQTSREEKSLSKLLSTYH